MFTITTATGKQFDCDCALAPKTSEFGFVHLLNTNLPTVERIFQNKAELPFDMCPDFTEVVGIDEVNGGIELMIKNKAFLEEEVNP